MLVMSKGALTAAQAETYYEEKYSQDDYYTEKQRVVGNWFGRGAEELGLSGEVATEDFRAVLRGLRHAKVTAAPPLTRNSGGACSTGTARHRLRRMILDENFRSGTQGGPQKGGAHTTRACRAIETGRRPSCRPPVSECGRTRPPLSARRLSYRADGEDCRHLARCAVLSRERAPCRR